MAQDLGHPGIETLPPVDSVAAIEAQLGSLWAREELARARAASAENARTEAGALEAARVVALARADSVGRERHVAARSSVLNLVVLAGRPETAAGCAATVAESGTHRPSRSLIISALDPDGAPGLEARVEALSPAVMGSRGGIGSETIYVTARGETGRHLASIIVPLLVHDLPVALWWPDEPQFDSHRADRLLPLADMLIVDGSCWPDNGLERLAAMARTARARSLPVVDFALLRQARWREAVASVYDLPDLRPHLGAVRSMAVEYSAERPGDPDGGTNVVRPLYHVAWLASRLGMSPVSPLRAASAGGYEALLRQRNHSVRVELRPVMSDLGPGSTVRVEIASSLRGSELVGTVIGGDLSVEVAVREGDRTRVQRCWRAPRLGEAELLERAVEQGGSDDVARDAVVMAGRLLAADDQAAGTPEGR